MPDNTDWEQTEGASEEGFVVVTYEETTYGSVLEFQVNEELVGNGQAHAVTEAEIFE